ncbi:MAG: tetratricopeptide repeat protein [Rhodospirillaceae bacterium]
MLALLAGVPAAAGPLEDGIAAYNRGDAKTALKLWQPLADQGNPDAQVNIGVLHANGEGVAQSYAEALKWYRRAADQGDVYALNNLGLMYMRGQGAQVSDRLAVTLYRQAADKNFAPAQFNLATMYAQGRGIELDKAEAYKWLTLAMAAYTPEDEGKRADAEDFLQHLARGMTPAESAEGERRAQEWKPLGGKAK